MEQEANTKRLTMDTYIDTLNGFGDKILTWADPENQYRGPTEVRKNCVLFLSRNPKSVL